MAIRHKSCGKYRPQMSPLKFLLRGRAISSDRSVRLVKHVLVCSVGGTLFFAGAATSQASVVNAATAASSDVAAAVASAVDGDTVIIPAGTATWTSGVNIGKAITIQGAGAAQFVGHSQTAATVGTGTKTFSLTARPGFVPSVGQTLRAIFPCNGSDYMQGIVSSYSGSTLVLNVTSSGGSGSFPYWTFLRIPAATTTIVNNCTAAPPFTISEAANGHVNLSGIYFRASNTNGPTPKGDHIVVNYASHGQAVIIHDVYFSVAGTGSQAILMTSNRGLIARCSFDSQFQNIATTHTGLGWNDEAIAFQNFNDPSSSWSTPSTIGAADTTGTNNVYVEDCYFAAMPVNAMDVSASSRAVIRYCIFDNSGFSSHGPDTGPVGLRHTEIYNNILVFTPGGDSDGTKTLGLNWFWWIRGGTAVITDNVFPAISSTAWGSKPTIKMTVLNIWRNTGPYACWTSYPAPHQVGQGYAAGAVFHSYTSPNVNYAEASYYTYSEPVYIWNNGGGAGASVSVQNDSSDACGHGQDVSTYIKSGREYFVGTPKPGYAKYTYPHPLLNNTLPAPANLRLGQ